MTKDEALAAFYQKNQIDPQRVADPGDGNYDRRLAALPDQVDRWLAGIRPEDHGIFLQLLSRYAYLSRAQCQQRYDILLDLIEAQSKERAFHLRDVLFITTESGGAGASGGDNVRADILGRNLGRLTKKQVIAAQSKLDVCDLSSCRAIVFLDDIIGSGYSLWDSIRTFSQRFSLTGKPDEPAMFYACVLPRKRGVRHIDQNCRKTGLRIEGLYLPEWLVGPAFDPASPVYQRVEPYEEKIGNYLTEDGQSFFMGFLKNRLLVSFYYNTPNNTLCTFWRMGPDTEPLFFRDGNQPRRPTIDELKATRQRMRDLSYKFGSDRQEHEKRGSDSD